MTIYEIDLNHPQFVCPYSPQAEWKNALIVELGERFCLRTLVETGTCYGDTIGRVLPHFKDIWSIELCPEYYEASKTRFASNSNVHLIFGSSGIELPFVILHAAPGPLLFWLDAHATGGISAGNGDQIMAELDAISRLRPDSLVLIDDVKPDETGYSGPDTHITAPEGWQVKFLSGVLAVHAGGYSIPERF